MAAARATAWCFTENVDPEIMAAALLDEGLPKGIRYIVAGYEKAPTTGQLHLQGYVQLTRQQRLSWLKKNLSHTAHFEPAKGSFAQNHDYCSKDGDYFELGTPTCQGARHDLLAVKEKIDAGVPLPQVYDQHFAESCRYSKFFKEYASTKIKTRDPSEGVEVEVHYGLPGKGKSRAVFSLYPDAYRKPVQSKWFDGYAGEETVIFDDFNGSWFTWALLMQITDRYPCTVETKFGHVNFAARRLVFTTNFHPKEWYSGEKHCLGALVRRITKVVFYSDSPICPIEVLDTPEKIKTMF